MPYAPEGATGVTKPVTVLINWMKASYSMLVFVGFEVDILSQGSTN
jgi:hypothetical protein